MPSGISKESLHDTTFQHFIDQFSANGENIGTDIKLHFNAHLRELYGVDESVQQIESNKPLLTRVNKWLARTYSEAYVKGFEHFRAQQLVFPRVLFQRLERKTLGQFEPKTQFVILRLQELLTYIEILRVSQSIHQKVKAEIQMELTIYEEIAHYFQFQDKSNLPHFRSYGVGWDTLTPEEKEKAYLSHPLERQAKLFAIGEVVRKFEKRAAQLLHTKDETEMKVRAYIEAEIAQQKEYARYLASL